MDLALKAVQRNARTRRKTADTGTPQNSNKYAIEEINAYIAVRDGLLEEAAEDPTEATVGRLVLTNNFVANCLRPTSPAYLKQCLPEVDAVRELKRCHAVDEQIVKLRTRIITAA
jgi:hypothetical protein